MNTKIHHLPELDPRMKLLLVVVFASVTFSAPNILALIWIYFLVIILYLARGLWQGAKKAGILFTVFLLLNLLLSFAPESGVAAGIGMILFMLERIVVFFVMGAWMGSHLRVSDFVTAMQSMHVHPIKTCEYAIVPLVIRSMTISDELAASAMTRGLDLESERTSYREVRLRLTDYLIAAGVILAIVSGIVISKMVCGR